MQCPFCGYKRFYIKDPDDEYETYEFDVKEGRVRFSEDIEKTEIPEISEETQAYCNKCSWNGKIKEL